MMGERVAGWRARGRQRRKPPPPRKKNHHRTPVSEKKERLQRRPARKALKGNEPASIMYKNFGEVAEDIHNLVQEFLTSKRS